MVFSIPPSSPPTKRHPAIDKFDSAIGSYIFLVEVSVYVRLYNATSTSTPFCGRLVFVSNIENGAAQHHSIGS